MAYIRNGYLHEAAVMVANIAMTAGNILVLQPEEIASLQLYSPFNTRVGTVQVYGRLNGGTRPWTLVHTEAVAAMTELNVIVDFPNTALRELGVRYVATAGTGSLSVDAAIKGKHPMRRDS